MGQSTSVGERVGLWFNGRPVYKSEMDRINVGVAKGKYVKYTDVLPAEYEFAFVLGEGDNAIKYASKMGKFKKWWMRNKGDIYAKISEHGRVSLEKAQKVGQIVIPFLIDSSADKAKELVRREFGDDIEAMGIVDAIVFQMGAAPPGAISQLPEKSGAGEPKRDLYFGSGGVLAKFGGADDEAGMDLTLLSGYVDSANSKAKKHIIDAVVEVAEGLKMQVSGSTPEEKVKSILKNLPRPEQFQKDKHKVACEALAMRLNKAYGSEIVSMKLPPDVICAQVAEVLNSLSSGMHSEFIAIYNDARRIVRNLQLLSSLMAKNHEKLVAELRAGDEGSRARIANYESIYAAIKAEIERQTALIMGLINGTLSPVDEELSKLMRAGGIKSLMEQVDVDKPGTGAFSKFLAELIKGMGVTAHFAALIENALKTVGMSMKEYAAAKSTQEFREKIAKGMAARDMSDKQFDEYLRAAELLFDNLERRKEIEEVSTSAGVTGASEEIEGGAEYERSRIEKSIENRKTERNLYFNTFHKEVNALFDGLLGNINILSQKVGEEIPLSENLDQFRRCLQRIQADDALLRRGGIYKQLMGYFIDASSKQKKEEFINKLKMLASSAATLTEMGAYASSRQYFVDIRTQVDAIIKLIDSYTDRVSARFGRGEEFTGGFEGGASALDEPPRLRYRAAKTIEESIDMFDFKYRLAHIKENLKLSAEETPKFFEGHENLVASSIAELLKEEKDKYDTLKVELAKHDNIDDKKFANDDAEIGVKFGDQRVAAGKVLDEIWETKKAFWVTIEAVDAYLREFTNGMVKSLDDIRDLRSMVENVEVIAEWYNDKSGNNFSSIFGFFPGEIEGNNFDAKVVLDPTFQEVDVHPYKKLAGKIPGNPHLVALPTEGQKAIKRTDETVRSFGLLKNFIAIFNKIGAKFGGESLSKKIPMTPATMYENLVRYIKTSAFAQGFCGKMVDKSLPTEWAASSNSNVALEYDNFDISDVPIFGGKTYTPNACVLGVGGLVVPRDSGGAPLTGSAAAKEEALLFRKRYGVWMRSIHSGLRDKEVFSFAKEDEYFVLAMKALAAKIFAIVNLQDVLARPADFSGLSSARVILGAADEIPKVEKATIPAYLRLLLLAQFYRHLFAFDGDKNEENIYHKRAELRANPNQQDVKISLVPDIDGTYADIIRLVFRKNRYVSSPNYSDDDVKEWIRAVNLVYQRVQSKHPTDTFNKLIHGFVAEINRRYGIVSTTNAQAVKNEFAERYDYGTETYPEGPDTEIPLLEGEGDDLPARPSASVRMLGDAFAPATAKKSRYFITTDHKKILYGFRDIFEKYFDNVDEEYTLSNAIHLAETKLDTTQDDTQRFKIVSSLIRGIDVYNKVDAMKYVLFHETVVAGLNTLSAIHTLLARFRQVALAVDVAQLEDILLTVLQSAHSDTAFEDAMKTYFGKTKVFPDPKSPRMFSKLLFSTEISIGGINYPVFQHDTALGKSGPVAGRLTPPGADNDELYTLLRGVSVANITGLKGKLFKKMTDAAVESDRKKLSTFVRYAISGSGILRFILEALFSLTDESSNLIESRVQDGKIYMNFNGMKDLVEKLFANVTHHLELLRPHLSDDIVKKYVDKQTAGSFYWLQEQLMEQLINGRPNMDPANGKYTTLEECARKISDAYEFATKKWDTVARYDAASKKFTVVDSDETNCRNSHAELLASMIHYDSTENGSGILASSDAVGNASAGVVDFRTDPMDMLHVDIGADGKKTLDSRYTMRFKQLYSWKSEFNLNRSTLMAFNQLVAQFVKNTFDPVTNKMYAGVINQFSQSNFNRAILDHSYTYPDMPPGLFIRSPEYLDDPYGPTATMRLNFKTTEDINSPYVRELFEVLNNNSELILGGPINGLLKDENLDHSIHDGPAVMWVLMFVSYALMVHKAMESLHNAMAADAALAGTGRGALAGNAALAEGIYILAGYLRNWNLAAPNGDGVWNAPGRTVSDLATAAGIVPNVPSISVVLNNLKNRALAGAPAATIKDLAQGYANYLLSLEVVEGGRWPHTQGYAPGAPHDQTKLYHAIMDSNEKIKICGRFVIDYIFGRTVVAQRKTLGAHFDVIKKLLPDGREELKTEDDRELFGTLLQLLGRNLNGGDYETDLILVRKAVLTPVVSKQRGKTEVSLMAKHEEIPNIVVDQFASPAVKLTAKDRIILVLARADEIKRGSHGVTLEGGSIIRDPLPQRPNHTAVDANDNLSNIISIQRRGDPDPDHVLYTSLAHIIKNLISSRTSSGSPYYLQENIADIPSYMKERMRANLPAFSSLFQALMQRCEFIKKILDRGEVDVGRDNIVGYQNTYPYVLSQPGGSSANLKLRYIGILDTISKGCAAFMKSCEQVVREIGDTEVFMETYQGSIKDYKVQNSADPFMPISNLLVTFENITYENHARFLPFSTLGETSFKFLYGTRLLLHKMDKQPLLEHAPGFMQIVDSFNMLTDDKFREDKKHAEDYFKNFIRAVRYIYGAHHLKGIMSSSITNDPSTVPLQGLSFDKMKFNKGTLSKKNLVVESLGRVAGIGSPYSNNQNIVFYDKTSEVASDISLITKELAVKTAGNSYAISAYSVGRSLQDIIRLTESTAKDDRIKEFVELLVKSADISESLEVRNIIDLDIVPINVHALSRDVPLATLYNYAYTFDRMVIKSYLGDKKPEEIRSTITNVEKNLLDDIKSPAELMASLLLNPHVKLTEDLTQVEDTAIKSQEPYRLLKMLMVGANGNDLGRPKYLSDQVFNKVLFGELYPDESDIVPTGPPARAMSDLHSSRKTNNKKILEEAMLTLTEAIVNDCYTNELIYNEPAVRVLVRLFIDNYDKNLEVVYTRINTAGTFDIAGSAKIASYGLGSIADGPENGLCTWIGIMKTAYSSAKLFVDSINVGFGIKYAKIAMIKLLLYMLLVLTIRYDPANKTRSLLLLLRFLNFVDQSGAITTKPGNVDISRAKPLNGIADFKDFIKILTDFGCMDFKPNMDIVSEVISLAFWFMRGEHNKAPRLAVGAFLSADKVVAVVSKINGLPMDVHGHLPNIDAWSPSKNFLTYPSGSTKTTVNRLESGEMKSLEKSTVLSSEMVHKLYVLGKLRLDTKLVRNIMFINNVYRTVALMLRRSLAYVGDDIATGVPAINGDLTEFYSNQSLAKKSDQHRKRWKRYEY